jgi:cytochrome oxidase Cu insertion factor (SCO1/SenC/PrrC family)
MSLNSNKTSLYLILGIPLIGIILTTAYYFYITSKGVQLETQNQGMLISPPKSITGVELQNSDGTKHVWYNGESMWTFMVVGSADCDEKCQQKLYLVRQIRSGLGKYSLRINTVYLTLDKNLTVDTAEFLAKEHPHTQVLSADAEKLTALFKSQSPMLDAINSANFYVVDPAGWVMMYYTSEHNYKDVNKDMKFLLKNS